MEFLFFVQSSPVAINWSLPPVFLVRSLSLKILGNIILTKVALLLWRVHVYVCEYDVSSNNIYILIHLSESMLYKKLELNTQYIKESNIFANISSSWSDIPVGTMIFNWYNSKKFGEKWLSYCHVRSFEML